MKGLIDLEEVRHLRARLDEHGAKSTSRDGALTVGPNCFGVTLPMDLKEKLLVQQLQTKKRVAIVLMASAGLMFLGGIAGIAGYELSFLSWKALMGAGVLGLAKGGYDLRAAQKTLEQLS